jgi:hypothetical protein
MPTLTERGATEVSGFGTSNCGHLATSPYVSFSVDAPESVLGCSYTTDDAKGARLTQLIFDRVSALVPGGPVQLRQLVSTGQRPMALARRRTSSNDRSRGLEDRERRRTRRIGGLVPAPVPRAPRELRIADQQHVAFRVLAGRVASGQRRLRAYRSLPTWHPRLEEETSHARRQDPFRHRRPRPQPRL